MRASRARLLPALAGPALVLALAACTASSPDPAPTPSVTEDATATAAPEPTATATAAPEPTATATEATEPAPTVSEESPNDPGDGVATDDPVEAPTPEGDATVAIADVLITGWDVSAGMVTATAVVEGVVAEGGTCTMTLSRGDVSLTSTGDATRSASSSNCASGMGVRAAGLEAGVWDLTIDFAAPGFAGSAQREVTLS